MTNTTQSSLNFTICTYSITQLSEVTRLTRREITMQNEPQTIETVKASLCRKAIIHSHVKCEHADIKRHPAEQSTLQVASEN